jgi:hypothetical protein
MPDRLVAKRVRVSLGVCFSQRAKLGIPRYDSLNDPKIWTPENVALLGTMSDAKLAQKLKISLSRVQRKRCSLGIKALRPAPGLTKPWFEELLGKISDRQLAKKTGLSYQNINQYRKRRGIPPFVEYKGYRRKTASQASAG